MRHLEGLKCYPACSGRELARKQGEFEYMLHLGGYVFTDIWGKPVVFYDCPFCGCELPTQGDNDSLGNPDE